jgi:DnaJ-class molecular chaperone
MGAEGGGFTSAGQRGPGGAGSSGRPVPVEAEVDLSLEEAFHGSSRIVEIDSTRLEVQVPRGVDTGSRIRLRGKGGGTGGTARDLYLVTKVRPHPVFSRTGADLTRELRVSLAEALFGADVPVATLKGRVLLTIPAGTQTGKTFRLAGQGMPRLKKEGGGDLYVKIRVVVPTKLTPEAEAAARDFLALVHQPSPRTGS